MRHSLKIKITLILTLLIFVLVALNWIANDIFLPKYSEYRKISSLEETYNKIYDLIGAEEFSYSENDTSKKLEKFENDTNNSINIIDLSAIQHGFGLTFLYPFSGSLNGQMSNLRNERYNNIRNALQIYIFGDDTTSNDVENVKTLKNYYDIYKIKDNNVDSTFIDLVGFLENQNMVFIRTNYSNIRESVAISNSFLILTGIVLLLIGIVVMFLFSRSLTKPILQLSSISKEMADLKFENHYTGNRKDEIGVLGNNINTLSDKLEASIGDLKAANIELARDNARKDEIDRMRREFLSNVSHELKTPIALIQGYAEGLAENINDDEEGRQFYCDVIIDESQKMNKIVKKLLSLNELEFGNVKPELERFDIVELTDSVTQSVNILARKNEAKVVFNRCEPIYIWADQYMIGEVITNYLSNALNHLGGKKVIDISFRKHDGKVRVSVFNTGEIIPEEEFDNIWDKFYKIDKARTREYGGSGIGLSIVKAIIESHNGAYGALNHGAGVEFWFELDTE